MAARQFRTTVDPRTVGVLLTADSGATTLTLNVPTTNTLPQSFPYTLVIDPDTTSEEIVTVTGGTTNVLTVVRAQDNTSLKEHAVGAAVRHMVTARDLQEPQEHMTATGRYVDTISGAYYEPHGLGSGHGVFVGTTKTQELTNKTITGATLSGSTTNSGTISGGTINATSVPASGITGTTLASGITTATGLTIAESQVTNLVSDLAAKAVKVDSQLTGTTSMVNATLSGTLTNNGTISGGAITSSNISTPALGTISVATGGTFALGAAGQITANGFNINATEVGYLDRISSNIQDQITGKLSIPTAWSTWTPTWGGTGASTSGVTTNTGSYIQIGKTVQFRINITMGTASFGSTGVTISLPDTPGNPIALTVGQCIAVNGSLRYGGQVLIHTGKYIIPLTTEDRSSPYSSRNITSSTPFTTSWSSTDQLIISGTYEVA